MHILIGLLIAVVGLVVVVGTLALSSTRRPADEYVPRHKAGADTGPVDA